METNKPLNIQERVTAPVPPFFKRLRTVGLLLAGVSGTLLAAPVPLPAAITNAAGYMAVAGTVVSMVSQLTMPETTTETES